MQQISTNICSKTFHIYYKIMGFRFTFFLFIFFIHDRNSNLNSHTLIFEDPRD